MGVKFKAGMLSSLLIAIVLLGGLPTVANATSPVEEKGLTSSQPVYVVPIQQTIETGLLKFLKRAYAEAEDVGAKFIVLDMNTVGGRIDSAEDIGKLIRESSVPSIAFVRGKAASAGSYIALNTHQIYMGPGSSIGAAAIVNVTGERVTDSKLIAHWASEMKAAAELNGRNTSIAEGMVDERIVVEMPEIERTKKAGDIISLTSQEAVKVGYAEGIAKDLAELLKIVEADGNPVIEFERTIAEKLAAFLTSPIVMVILLIIGIAGIVIELFIPGFGVPGILGIVSFGLYFFGHYVAGFAGLEEVALFVAGIALLIIEVFVPSFGILGILGIASLVGGIVLSAYDTSNALLSLVISSLIAFIIIAIVVKFFKHKGIWNRFILKDELNTDQGYVSSSEKSHLLHQTGKSITPLRPAGTILIHEDRIDVVTEGEFIELGKSVKVIKVDGTRVVVKQLEESE